MSGPVCPHCERDIYDACLANAHNCTWYVWPQSGEERYAQEISGHTAASAVREYVWFEYDYSRRALNAGWEMHFYVRRKNSDAVIPMTVIGEWRPEYMVHEGKPLPREGAA